jgi:hypothetical protein
MDTMQDQSTELKNKILAEMTVEYSSNLERNFDLAKQFIRITREGMIDVLVKSKINGTEQVLLYLIGKMYAKEAGLAPTDEVSNNELMEQLAVPVGSILPWLKELRDKNMIKQVKRDNKTYHTILVNRVESTLKTIQAKLLKK